MCLEVDIVSDGGASRIDDAPYSVVPFWLQELKDKEGQDEPEWEALDTPDISQADFARFIELNAAVKLKTAQPNPGQWAVGFRRTLSGSKSAIGLAMTYGISKSVNSALKAAKDVAEETGQRIEVVDCRSTSMIQAMIALNASEMAKDGAGFDDVLNAIKLLTQQTHVSQIFSDIEHLYRGGRISYVSYMAATALKIIPIVSFVDYPGKEEDLQGQVILDVVRRARRWEGAIPAAVQHVKDAVNDLPVWIGYVHNGVQDHLIQLIDEVNQAGFNVVREPVFTQQNLVLNVYSGDRESIGFGAIVMPPELC